MANVIIATINITAAAVAFTLIAVASISTNATLIAIAADARTVVKEHSPRAVRLAPPSCRGRRACPPSPSPAPSPLTPPSRSALACRRSVIVDKIQARVSPGAGRVTRVARFPEPHRGGSLPLRHVHHLLGTVDSSFVGTVDSPFVGTVDSSFVGTDTFATAATLALNGAALAVATLAADALVVTLAAALVVTLAAAALVVTLTDAALVVTLADAALVVTLADAALADALAERSPGAPRRSLCTGPPSPAAPPPWSP